ncbi:MAG TPA: hypothetical protein VKE69_03420 [Planctomycetota bacterium]|nr:hypothetical protein [Planctomycetota bacterium]
MTRRALAVAGAAGFSAAALATLVASMLHRTGGTLCLPIDDGFIYLQYARRLAQGHPFSYCDGASPSTGATSWLHTVMLAPGWWLGLRGSSYVVWSLAVGFAYLTASLLLLPRVAAAVVPSCTRWAVAVAVVLVAGNGQALWSAFSGMDTWLHATWMLGVLALVAARGPSSRAAWIAAALLAWVRPEGVFFGGLACAVLALASRDPLRARARNVVAAALLLVVPVATTFVVTGTPKTDTFAVKSLLAIPDWAPRAPRGEELSHNVQDLLYQYLTDFEYISDGQSAEFALPRPIVAPLAGLLAIFLVVGIAAGLRGRGGVTGRLVAMWFLASAVVNTVATYPFSRYLYSYLPIVALVEAMGAAAVASLLPAAAARIVRWSLPVAAAPLLVTGLVRTQNYYGWHCENTEHQQARIGHWIADHVPAGERVALNDAGAITYYGERPILDMVGLVTHGWAGVHHSVSAATFEHLVALPDRERPKVLAIYDSWFQELAASRFGGKVVFEAKLDHNRANADAIAVVREPSWPTAEERERARSTIAAPPGMAVVDEIEIADLRSEASHDHAILGISTPRLRDLAREPDRPTFLDGGRMHLVGESMRAHVRPGSALRIVARVDGELGCNVAIRVDGKDAGFLRAAPEAGRWLEPYLDVPAELVRSSAVVVEARTAGGLFATFRWWFLQ